MNRRDLLKGVVAVAGASMVPASTAAETFINPVSVAPDIEISINWNKTLDVIKSFAYKKNTECGFRHVFCSGYDIHKSYHEYETIPFFADNIDIVKTMAWNSIETYIKNNPEIVDDQAKALFDAEPHNHSRGHIPDWNRQPQFIKNVYLKRVKGN